MALFPEGTNGAVQNLANKGIKKAVNYGSKYLNNKLNYGLNYARSFIRQYDVLGILPEQWTILDEEQEKVFGFDTFQSLNSKKENKVTQMPVEGGSFVDYNIVETPRELTCIISGTPGWGHPHRCGRRRCICGCRVPWAWRGWPGSCRRC